MRRTVAMIAAAVSLAACNGAPLTPEAPAIGGEYQLDRANDVAMPGTLAFSDGVTVTYRPGTHLSLANGHYEMVLDYSSRDANGEQPWVWQMQGDYAVRGDTVVLDPNGGDWNGQRVLVHGTELKMAMGGPADRVREMVFSR
ncbi:MAG TPA: hypothetical protein VFE05_00780 [Longimicrobiaceae bacterium]|jgi:hypothetical protein|nr:hypothetical protein [Longimicrobiaceae bacterium]